MNCQVCAAAARGTCSACHRLFCEQHWGGPEAPRCEECHRSLRWSLTVTGVAILLLGVGIIFYFPGPPIGAPLILLAVVVLWRASLRFRSARTREVAVNPELADEPAEPEDLASAEPETCLRCRAEIPQGSARCPECGWSYATDAGK